MNSEKKIFLQAQTKFWCTLKGWKMITEKLILVSKQQLKHLHSALVQTWQRRKDKILLR